MTREAQRFALLIGIDDYSALDGHPERSIQSLEGCVGDIDAIQHQLQSRLGVPQDHIVRLTAPRRGAPGTGDPRPTRERIIQAFDELLERVEPGDRLWIHYSGHGGQPPTAFQSVKGSNGFDQSLIPADYAATGHVLRDLELACLLGRFIKKKLDLTVALDCCHSGGGLAVPERALYEAESRLRSKRSGEIAVRGIRGIGTITAPLAPVDDRVATTAELCGAQQRGVRDLKGTSGWLPSVSGYLLLAACRSTESAREVQYPGGRIGGAFTMALIEVLERDEPLPTAQQVHHHLVARVHSNIADQTPQVEGAVDRLIDGSGQGALHRGILVLGPDDRGRVRLSCGRAHGVRQGARVVVQPRPGRPVAAGAAPAGGRVIRDASGQPTELIISEIEAAESWAEPCAGHTVASVREGDLATLVDAGLGSFRQTVLVDTSVPAPTRRGREVLEMLHDALRAELGARTERFIDLVADESHGSPDIRIGLDPSGTLCLMTPDQKPLPNLPSIDAGGERAVTALIAQLEHLAKYRNVEELENHSTSSPLRDRLEVNIYRLPPGFDDSDSPRTFERNMTLLEPDELLTTGTWICLAVTNHWEDTLNLAVLDLQPAWSIAQVIPASAGLEAFTLRAGMRELFPLQASLPKGIDEGEDLLKVMVTARPTSFRCLQLPRPGERDTRRAHRAPANALEAVLQQAALRAPSTKRDVLSVDDIGKLWHVEQRRIRMVRPRT